MSFAVWVKLPGEPEATNAVRYATEAEAKRAGDSLMARWFVPIGYEIRESDDPVNYEWPEGESHPRHLKED